MAGSDGNRGYLIQTLIALITSLDDMSWDCVSIEPDHESEKIDILWEGDERIACQVKSSINQINKHHATKWAKELEDDVDADVYQLALVGPCAQSVVQLEKVGAVQIPTPKNNDLSNLISLAAHLLDKNILTKELGNIGPVMRELIAHALVGKLSTYASSGESLTRTNFIGLIVDWAGSVPTPINEFWQLIQFESQRGLENAIAGKKLGPSDVEICPRFEECDDIYTQIERSHTFSIVGQSGTGKSISAWQVAYQFHQLGFSVFRPYLSEDSRSLLESIPKDEKSLLVIDDSQVFDSKFVEQLVEMSNSSLKVIFTSSHPMKIGRDMNTVLGKANLKLLESELLARRDETLTAVRKFDERIGDGFSDESLERRLNFCTKEDTPWQFFWLLRGGWNTARAELRSVSELPNAKVILIIISAYQIASCDTGLTHSQLCELASKKDIDIAATERAIQVLLDFNQIEFERGILRTKHFQFAHEIIQISTEASSIEKWDIDVDILETIIAMPEIGPQGVYGLLKALRAIVLREGDQLRFETVFHIVEKTLFR